MNGEYDLTLYGAHEYFYTEALAYPDLQMARVIAQYKELYKIAAAYGEVLAEISGKLRYEVKNICEYPVTGDFVMTSPAPAHEGNAVIHAVLPRKTVLGRLSAGNAKEQQIIAANIDIIFICVSLNSNYSLNRIERYLSAAWNSAAQPVVVLTKSDMCHDLENKLQEVSLICPGADVITATNKDTLSCEKLRAYLKPGVTASFIGSSGVGKSTLINLLAGKELLETQSIRDDEKGRHTTTRRELFLLPGGGSVIDTPGMREFGVEAVDLSKTFSDIDELVKRCRFADCAHASEPGCAVQKAIASGELDKRRFESYQKLK
ncbi:MAG: ribosome small subunit-dependent GTPase A, partial [Spirochaetales bacterium]|nr:ribosome small subunit-dependent GTPase A [Spirochaetales bacterium]